MSNVSEEPEELGWLPFRRRVSLTAAVPATYGSTEHSLLLKTVKWGLLARLAAVFRVDELVIYVDEPWASEEAQLGSMVLRYAVSPPYLRKKLFPRSPLLRYAGILPPVQLPTHGVGGPRPGECREALVLRRRGSLALVEAGLGKPYWLRIDGRPGELVLVSLDEKLRLRPGCPWPVYRGYKVRVVEGLRSVVVGLRRSAVVATSRAGRMVGQGVLRAICRDAVRRGGILVLFGAPSRGLFDIASSEGLRLEELADYVVNTIPQQGTRTVRVEEAFAATMALLNVCLP